MVLKSIKRKFFYLFALVFTATILLFYSVVVQPLNCEKTELVIPQGSSLAYVIDELKRCKCIKNGEYFKYLMVITSKDTKIKPGTYDLSAVNNNYELSNLISTGTGEMIAVSILEGWSIDEMSKMFFRKFDIDQEKFKKLCKDEEFIKSLGISSNSLEGYLYPETYMFSKDFIYSNNKEIEIIKTLVNEFKIKFKKATKGRYSHNLSMHEILTLASIIQGECVYSSEMDTVSSVYHNRLVRGMKLQADPTIQYIIPGPNKRLYNKDYHRYKDNPYNTYSHNGLPPGPINNPGFDAIKAAAYPAKTNFLYFVAKGNNQHHFTTNERDHINAKNKFLKEVWDKY